MDCDVITEDCDVGHRHKKHGIWCTVMTKLRLKKRKGQRRKSKNRENYVIDTSDEDKLITSSSTNSIPRLADEYAYRGRRVDFTVIPDGYDLLEEVNYDVTSTINDSGIYEHSICSDDLENIDEDDDVIMADRVKQLTVKEYLVKKWGGKRAKRVRKGIRRSSGNALKYLQTSLQLQFIFPDASTLITVAHNNR